MFQKNSSLGGDYMFKILEKRKKQDDIKLKKFKDEMDYQYSEFNKKNNKKMNELKDKRKIKSHTNKHSSLWKEAIKNGKF